MNNVNLYEILCQEKLWLQNLMESLLEEEKVLPKGKLRVAVNKEKYKQYFWIKPQTRQDFPNGKYLKKDQIDVAEGLAKREYDAKLLECIRRRLDGIERMISEYERDDFERCFWEMEPKVRELVRPIILSDAMYAKKWLEEQRGGQNPSLIEDDFFTERGEHVRSKSEKIIADKFYMRGIPYVYEPMFVMWDGKEVYPDFKVLNTRTRKEYFFEHLGKMDDAGYSERNSKKLEDYMRSGIWPGERLLFSTETKARPLNIRVLDALVDKYLV